MRDIFLAVLLIGLAPLWAACSPSGAAAPPSPPESPRDASLGMGLTGISDWSGQYAFIDMMKQARGWKDWRGKTGDIAVDAHDWVTQLAPGQTAGTVFLTVGDDAEPLFERAIVLYDGKGELSYGWSAKLLAEQSKPGRHVIALSRGNHLLEITATDPADPVRNIRIIPEPLYPAFRKGEIFNPAWLERLQPFRALRFMDWLSTNNSTLRHWNDRPRPEDRSYATNGVPLEIAITLANRLQAVPWVNIAHLADDDYVLKFAELIHKTLDPALTVYVEHSNEVWNWQFQQAQYANREGRARWGNVGNAYMQYHGMRTAQICDVFKQQVFARQPHRVKCVLGLHTANRHIASAALECPLWRERRGACHRHGIDFVGITGYFSGHLNGPRKDGNERHAKIIKSWAKAGATGLDQAFTQLRTGEPLQALKLDRERPFKGVAAKMRDDIEHWVKAAQKYDLGVVAYEGGQHITANAHQLQDDVEVTAFHAALSRDPRMGEIYQAMLTEWRAGGGQLFMHFVDISQSSKWGSWGALTYLGDEKSPKWDALIEFNAKHRCWWPNCAPPSTGAP